jgi:hypothetical protein
MLFYLILGLIVFAAYKTYKFLQVPPELKNIPSVPLLTFFKYNLNKRCFREKVDDYFQSQFNEFGVVRVNLTNIF